MGLEGGVIPQEGGPVDRRAGRLVPCCEMLRDQVVYGGRIRKNALVELEAVETVDLCVLLQDRRDDPFEFALLTESFPGARGVTDLASEFSAEPSMEAELKLVYDTRAEARTTYHTQGGAAPERGWEPRAVEPATCVRWGSPSHAADGTFPDRDDAGEGQVHLILGVPWRVAAVSMQVPMYGSDCHELCF